MLRVYVCVEYSCNCVRVLNVVCVSALLTQQSERAVTSITQFLLKLTLTLRSYVNVMPSSISRCMISQKALNSCSKTLGEIITKPQLTSCSSAAADGVVWIMASKRATVAAAAYSFMITYFLLFIHVSI